MDFIKYKLTNTLILLFYSYQHVIVEMVAATEQSV